MPDAPQTKGKSKREWLSNLKWRKSSSKGNESTAQASSSQALPDHTLVKVEHDSVSGTTVDQTKSSPPNAKAPGNDLGDNANQSQSDDGLHLNAFHVDNVTPGSELDVAQNELRTSLQRLEHVLCAQRSSDQYITDPQKVLESNTSRLPPTTFTALAKELQQANDNSASTLSAKIGKFMVALYPGAKFLLNVAGIGLTAASFAPAQIAANGVAQILELAIEPSRKTDEVLSGLDMMLEDQHFLDGLQRFPIYAIDESIVVRALKLQKALSEFIRESVVWLRKHAMTKFVTDAFGIQDVRVAIEDLNFARVALKRAMDTEFYLTAKLRDLEAQDNKTLDRMIARQDCIYHIARQRDLHDKRLPNSGESIVKDPRYQQWCSGDLSSLWCDGLAGAGKTFACSAVVDDLELRCRDQTIGLAYFYCRFEYRLQQTQHDLLGTLTRQLASRRPIGEIKDKLPQHSEMPLLSDRKALFKAALALFKTTFIVIDAVDEYSETHGVRAEMVEMISEMQAAVGAANCHLCFTSREADDIFALLTSAAKVPVSASEREISNYVEQEFVYNKAHRHAANMVRQDPALLQDVVDGVIEKSDCIFQLATLQVRELIKCNTPPDVRSTLSNLTSDIYDYYTATLNRIRKKDERTMTTLLKLIGWVVCAKHGADMGHLSLALGYIPERITDDDVASAGTWAIPDLQSYVSDCEGLLAIQEDMVFHQFYSEWSYARLSTKSVALTHETVSAYFREHLDRLNVEGSPSVMIMNTYMRFLRACGHFQLPCAESVSNLLLRARQTWMVDCRPPNESMLMLDHFQAFALTWGSYAEEAIEQDWRAEGSVLEFMHWLDSYPDMLGGWSTIHWCAHQGWVLPLYLLLDSGVNPDLNAQDNGHYDQGQFAPPDTPLWLVIRSELGSEEDKMRILRRLIEREGVAISRTISSVPLLVYCAGHHIPQMDRIRLVTFLLAGSDVDVNEPDRFGRTALAVAAKRRHTNLVILLLNHPETDPNHHDVFGRTVLMDLVSPKANHLTCDPAKGGELIHILVQHREVDLDETDHEGLAALHLALLQSFSGIEKIDIAAHIRHRSSGEELYMIGVRAIVAQKGRVNLTIADRMGHSPLDYAKAAVDVAERIQQLIQSQFFDQVGFQISDTDPLITNLDPQLDNWTEEQDLERMGPIGWWWFAFRLRLERLQMLCILGNAGAKSLKPFVIPRAEEDAFMPWPRYWHSWYSRLAFRAMAFAPEMQDITGLGSEYYYDDYRNRYWRVPMRSGSTDTDLLSSPYGSSRGSLPHDLESSEESSYDSEDSEDPSFDMDRASINTVPEYLVSEVEPSGVVVSFGPGLEVEYGHEPMRSLRRPRIRR